MSKKVKQTEDPAIIETIAKACHEANRVWCQHNGDMTQAHWDDATLEERNSTMKGVEHLLKNPNVSLEDLHEEWLEAMTADGWTYGEFKDSEKKTNPFMLPYNKLPEFVIKRDRLFSSIVEALR